MHSFIIEMIFTSNVEKHAQVRLMASVPASFTSYEMTENVPQNGLSIVNWYWLSKISNVHSVSNSIRQHWHHHAGFGLSSGICPLVWACCCYFWVVSLVAVCRNTIVILSHNDYVATYHSPFRWLGRKYQLWCSWQSWLCSDREGKVLKKCLIHLKWKSLSSFRLMWSPMSEEEL